MLFSVGPVGGFVAVEVGAACDDDDVGVELSGVTGGTMVEFGVPEVVRERQNVWRLSTERIQENMGVLEQLSELGVLAAQSVVLHRAGADR